MGIADENVMLVAGNKSSHGKILVFVVFAKSRDRKVSSDCKSRLSATYSQSGDNYC